MVININSNQVIIKNQITNCTCVLHADQGRGQRVQFFTAHGLATAVAAAGARLARLRLPDAARQPGGSDVRTLAAGAARFAAQRRRRRLDVRLLRERTVAVGGGRGGGAERSAAGRGAQPLAPHAAVPHGRRTGRVVARRRGRRVAALGHARPLAAVQRAGVVVFGAVAAAKRRRQLQRQPVHPPKPDDAQLGRSSAVQQSQGLWRTQEVRPFF